ncbi:MAG: PH domain-containing protein [Euryarchaeota archaeon]|nr:PH domain-containing protein [Euryarchaeota archaeon]
MRTTGTKVVCLELGDKYIMLSPDRFDDFVEELNEEFMAVG